MEICHTVIAFLSFLFAGEKFIPTLKLQFTYHTL